MTKRAADAKLTGELQVMRMRDVDVTAIADLHLKGLPRKQGAALLEVPDPSNFKVSFYGHGAAGIALASVNLDVRKPCDTVHGFFIPSSGGFMRWRDATTDESCRLPASLGFTATASNPFQLKFSLTASGLPELWIGHVGEALGQVSFSKPIPTGSYRPCILLHGVGDLHVAVEPSRKRSKQDDHSAASMAQMWEDRYFTDAEIVCQGRAWKVHRCVLCVSSPVLAAAFGGQMQEAKSSRMDINEATADDVEAMLRFIYTGDLNNGSANASSLLLLAHRYDVKGLVQRCGDHILDALSKDVVTDVVRCLRALRQDAEIQPLWKTVLDRVFDDRELFEAAMEEL
mmetsp:Transcript_73715/g.146125  ORF Transcript_73715/g.146125 Transcript_73715/m.146125 type:complete len:343 (+) Transcript_73715:80-1108(+)|eukprot:CAMPEP_0172689406 /NCGR_PEP_ID=MMETSP1074-20121228/23117_1 /TAXON_ID=2916 /ORGANISM="Ceratium fusus, Strain PA161109" /LENGTH=342 /DNA_ID=CAMNT_0013509205 /DNA_START=73 /DNA_END=1101 /DNA_ORIENTATION=-